MTSEQELLTVIEAARMLRVGRNLAYELVHRGEIPAIRVGRMIRVPRAALVAWIDEQSGIGLPLAADRSVDDGDSGSGEPGCHRDTLPEPRRADAERGSSMS